MAMDYEDAQLVNRIKDKVGELLEKQVGLRDQFAMAALTGILANSEGGEYSKEIQADIPSFICTLSYEYADKMLQAREVTE